METSRLKTIAIIILLLVNACFLTLYVINAYGKADREAESRREICSFLLKNGIVIDEKVIPAAPKCGLYTFSRDTAREKALAESLLGSVSSEEQGGSVYYYYNEHGEARFSNIEFEIIIENSERPDKSTDEVANELLSLMSITADTANPVKSFIDSTAYISYACSTSAGNVYNCNVQFEITPSETTLIRGNRLIDSLQYTGEGEIISPVTALVRFLSELRDIGGICSIIESMEAGYVMIASASSGTLEPVWKIVTDGGIYYLDGTSGKIVSGFTEMFRVF